MNKDILGLGCPLVMYSHSVCIETTLQTLLVSTKTKCQYFYCIVFVVFYVVFLYIYKVKS